MMFSNEFTCLREVTADLMSVFICGATVQGKVGVFTVSQINAQFSLHLQQLTVPTPSGSRAFQLPVIFRDTFLLIIGEETISIYEVRPRDVVLSNTPENELASVLFFLARLLKGLFCCTAIG